MPSAWRVAGVIEVLLALAALTVSLSETEIPARAGVGLVIALGLATLGGGLLTGRVWAYWPSAALLALFAFLLAVDALRDLDAWRALATGVIVGALGGLFLPSSRRLRVHVEIAEDREAFRRGWLVPGRTRSLLALWGIAIASLGVLLFATGYANERFVWLTAILFGSAAVLVSLGSRPTGKPSDPETGTVTYKGSAQPALLFHLNKRQGRALAAGSVAMAAASGFMAAAEFTAPREDIIYGIVGIAGAAFFALCSLAWGSSSIRGAVALVRDGILVPFLGTVFIPWEAVRKAAVFDFGVPMLGIDVSDPRTVQMPSWKRALNALNRQLLNAASRRLSVWDLTFPSALLGSPPRLFERAVHHYRDHPDERRHIGSELPPGFTEPSEDS